jgi:hypothetical protein
MRKLITYSKISENIEFRNWTYKLWLIFSSYVALFLQIVWTFQNVRTFRTFVESSHTDIQSRVARWFIFKPKFPTWVNFGGPYNGSCLYILRPFGQFSGHLVYFMALWYILWSVGIFSPFWYIFPTKNLATMIQSVSCERNASYEKCK